MKKTLLAELNVKEYHAIKREATDLEAAISNQLDIIFDILEEYGFPSETMLHMTLRPRDYYKDIVAIDENTDEYILNVAEWEDHKYVVWVNLGGEMQGEYDGVEYETREEAEKVMREAEQEPRILDAWIEER